MLYLQLFSLYLFLYELALLREKFQTISSAGFRHVLIFVFLLNQYFRFVFGSIAAIHSLESVTNDAAADEGRVCFDR